MRPSSLFLLAFLALPGCASQRQSHGEPPVAPTTGSIVAVEVTNPFDRTIDIFYSTQFLGTLAPRAHGSYPVAPTTTRAPIYARWSGRETQRVNLSRSPSVRYVYEDRGDVRSAGARRCTATAC
jgi:hypothetical protein